MHDEIEAANRTLAAMFGLVAQIFNGLGVQWFLNRGSPDYISREGVSIAFPLGRKTTRRNALETVEKGLIHSKCAFLARAESHWEINLGILRELNPSWSDATWLTGTIKVDPDVDEGEATSLVCHPERGPFRRQYTTTTVHFLAFREDIEKTKEQRVINDSNAKSTFGFQAIVVKVMIASPADVTTERQIIRDEIAEWNVIHADTKRVVLLPVSWDSNVVPSMKEPAQAVINRHVLADCQILVAVFWTRLGTPTESAESGTAEEIKEHVGRDGTTIIYFSEAPIAPKDIDEKQRKALMKFKDWCRSNGLIHEYDSHETFRASFRRHLSLELNKMFPVSSPEFADPKSASSAWQHNLSTEAKTILREAVLSSDGSVWAIGTLSGWSIQTNSKHFGDTDDPREEAKWKNAIRILQRMELVEDQSGKGELFQVTERGFELGDSLLSEE